jgi:uncharacterized caspase-like protein
LIAVRNDVIRATKQQQVPWEHSALTERFYFNVPDRPSAVVAGSPAQFSEAERAWALAQGTKSTAVLEAFVARFKDQDPFYAALARERLAELNKK